MAAGNTYTPLATQTLGSAAASVTFSSISGSYTDLVLVFRGKITTGSPTSRLQFNGDTGSNYSATMLYVDSSSMGGVRVTNEASANTGALSDEFGITIIQLNNYSNTTTYKTTFSRYTSLGTSYREIGSKLNLWRNTSAITSIVISPASSTFTSGTTFTLYGIAAA
jgi:peptide methionine sulfoxide reductase MsrA